MYFCASGHAPLLGRAAGPPLRSEETAREPAPLGTPLRAMATTSERRHSQDPIFDERVTSPRATPNGTREGCCGGWR